MRLPTGAEWEYACRAESDGPYCFGDDVEKLEEYAWYRGISPNSYHEVGQKKPNDWGLHDMHGNAAEWTRSPYHPYPCPETSPDRRAERTERRVVRGGSWRDRPKRCRSAFRLAYPAHQRVFNVGFRVVIEDGPVVVRQD